MVSESALRVRHLYVFHTVLNKRAESLEIRCNQTAHESDFRLLLDLYLKLHTPQQGGRPIVGTFSFWRGQNSDPAQYIDLSLKRDLRP